MRFFPTALVIGLLAAMPASAQNESVTVTGQESLTGVWKLSSRPGAPAESFCRIEQRGTSLAVRCLPGPPKRTGTIDGAKLELTWPAIGVPGSIDVPGLRWTNESVLESPIVFSGVSSLNIFGVAISARPDLIVPLIAHKSVSATPDTAGKASVLTATLEELARGAVTSPHDAAMAANVSTMPANKPSEMRALGKIQTVIYMGEGASKRGEWQPDSKTWSLPPFPYSVYQVEFEKGQRLCGIHQRDDGVIDGFLCV